MSASRLQLSLLSGFELRDGRAAVSLPLAAQRLVAFVALHGKPVLRGFVAGNLWSEFSDEQASRSLRTALWRVRKHAREVVTVSESHVGLGEEVAVDVFQTTEYARRLLRGDADCVDAVKPSQFAGDLLPDWYDEWVVMERERFRQLRLHALEALCVRFTSLGRYPDAVEAGLAAVAGEPLRESANLALVRAHLAEGNVSEALRCYDRFRLQLHVELAIAPSRRAREVIESACLPEVAVDCDGANELESRRSQATRLVAAGQPTI
jgi:DNA-binding SARP family transcriptional activator